MKFKDLLTWPFNKKKTQEIPEIRIPQITDYPAGQELNNRILAALQKGQNIGFPEGYVEKSTSPFIQSRQAGWTERELPFLNAEYGARGMSRSSLAARDIGKAFAQKERDINEIIANAYLNDIAQRKTDLARYENLAGDFASKQAGIGTTQAQMDYQRNLGNIGIQQQADAQQSQDINSLISTGLGVASIAATPTYAPFTMASLFGSNNQESILKKIENSLNKSSNTKAFVPTYSLSW